MFHSQDVLTVHARVPMVHTYVPAGMYCCHVCLLDTVFVTIYVHTYLRTYVCM